MIWVTLYINPGGLRKRLHSGIRLTFNVVFSFLVAAKVDLMVTWIGPITPLLLLVDHFGPIRDTVESSVAATGI